MIKALKRHCNKCGKDFWCNNKCGIRSSSSTDCYCKWCCQKLKDGGYNWDDVGCEHYKSDPNIEEKVVFT